MANIEYKRLVTKSGDGPATVPPSASHDIGDWIATDIYENELYMDNLTGALYTNIAGVIVQLDSSAIGQATETEAGIAEIATQTETNDGLDDERIVTPFKLIEWWNYIKTLTATITGIWYFYGEKFRIVRPGFATYTSLTTDTASNQIWTLPDEGDQTFASRNYVLSAVAGLMDYRGTFDASVNDYPSSGGSGSAGAILKSDFWIVSVAGTLSTGIIVEPGDLVMAKIDTPGSTPENWDTVQYNIGFTPENAANKDASGGYVGLDTWKIKFRNAADSFTSFLVNAATAARTYTFPDRDITVAGTDDLILMLSQYKAIRQGGTFLQGGDTAGLWWTGFITSNRSKSGVASNFPPSIITIDSADFPTVLGKTPKLRIRATFAVNDVAPTGNFTVGLYELSGPTSGVTGGIGTRVYTAGALVTGSDGANVNAPAADSITYDATADFDLPANGTYALAVESTAAALAVSSGIHIMVELDLHYT